MTTPEILEFRTSDGLRLEAEAYGAGPTILLAHGGGQTRYSWRHVAQAQAEKGWRTVAIDLRGHGASDWDPNKDYSLERYGRDIAEVAAALGGDIYHVGASLGGNSALAAVGRFAPDLFRALVLVDVVPHVDAAGVAEVLGFMGDHLDEGFADLEEASRAVSAYRKQAPRPQGQSSGLARYLKPRADGRLVWHWDPAFVIGDRPGRLSPQAALQLEQDLKNITCPILLLRGLDSNLVTDAAEISFRQAVPQAQVWHVGAAGHMVVGDNNTQFAADLDRFLNAVRDPSGTAPEIIREDI